MSARERLTGAGFEVPGPPQPESRYFPPTERCPNPERWHSTDGDSTELEVSELVAALVRALQPDVVVETGAAFGQTTALIVKALRANGHGHLYALEWDDVRADYTIEYIDEVFTFGDPSIRAALGGTHGDIARHLTIVRGSSLDWSPPGDVDVLFSDSNYETRVPETLRLLPFMRVGATVLFHDSGAGRGAHRLDGVSLREEVEAKLVQAGLLRCVDLPTPRGLTICEVL